MSRKIVGLTLVLVAVGASALAQWTHRYPKVEGYAHHVYLEGFELPILNAGPSDPAPSRDGTSIAFAARGFLWLLDLETGVARRLTRSSGIDSRPAWSADGAELAFLRDDTEDLDIWVLDVASGTERPLVEGATIELDPAYSADGEFLYYTSGEAGDLDVWRLQLGTSERMPMTSRPGIELRPLPTTGGDGFVFLAKGRGGADSLIAIDPETKAERVLRAQSIVSQTYPGVSPGGETLVVNWPGPDGYDLYLVDPTQVDAIRLNPRPGLPLSPAFGADGETIYFVEANDAEELELFAIPTTGGEAAAVPIRSWDWGEPTGFLEVRTHWGDDAAPVASRLHVVDGRGHPAVPSVGMPRFDGTHGKVFFYSTGVVTLEVPVGEVRVEASRGFSAPAVSSTATVSAGGTTVVDLTFEPLWEPRADGWYAGDHHYHMNYGGPYRLEPSDLLLLLEGEDMDVGTPLMANLHHRFNDLEYFGYRHLSELPFLRFGQEVRSHFLGHLGLVNIEAPHWPWYWGPGYPVYGADDRPNHEVLRFARHQGGYSSYMHPVSRTEPFADPAAMRSIPINLIPDAVLGDLDFIELACLWTSELGTGDVWYRFLNIGAPVAASAGTDIMADYYRTMAVGATRIYVKVDEPVTFERYLSAWKAGRSFVSTGPLVDFRVGESRPGDVVPPGETGFSLRLSSPVPVEKVEIIVNGEILHTEPGLAAPGEKRISGSLSLPAGGWVAARAHGGEEVWPSMNGYPFAHSSPIWIGARGSTDPDAARAAARELLAALDVAETRLDEGYGAHPIPKLEARFREAREHLTSLSR